MAKTKKEIEEKKEYARLLYMQGEQQKVIAEKVGISAQSLSRWVADGGWQEHRAASNITRPELVNKLLLTINRLIESVNESEDPTAIGGLSDKLSKLASTIERLDKKASIVDVVEVFMAFSKWLQFRMSFDDEVTPELLRTINKYHDLYISEILQGKFTA